MRCSSLWRPHQLNHIEATEKLQRRATKYILSDYISNYKSRLIQLGILPLMYIFELADIMFFIKSVKCPTDKFNILDYIEFNTGPTRSAIQKLRHKQANTNLVMNSYFYRLPRLWNSLLVIDLSFSLAVIKHKLKAYFWDHFIVNFDSISHVLITTSVLVVNVIRLLPLVIIIAYNVTVYSISFFYCIFLLYVASHSMWLIVN